MIQSVLEQQQQQYEIQPNSLLTPLPTQTQQQQQQQQQYNNNTNNSTTLTPANATNNKASQNNSESVFSFDNNNSNNNINNTSNSNADIWIIQDHTYSGSKPTSFTERLWMKANQDPIIPIGLALTTAALSGGVWSFITGRRHLSQRFMWARVGFQGVTAGALAYAMMYKANQSSKQNIETAEDKYRNERLVA